MSLAQRSVGKPASTGLKGKAQHEKQDALQPASIYAGERRRFSEPGNAFGNRRTPEAIPDTEQLQQSIGNQAVLRGLQSGLHPASVAGVFSLQPLIGNHGMAVRLQAKLEVNMPGDRYEQEADCVADQVIRMPKPNAAVPPMPSSAASGVQRACSCSGTCEECQSEHFSGEHNHLQMKPLGAAGPGHGTIPPIVHSVLNSPGRPLDSATRSFMEPRFGHDFSHVRIHTGEQADESARSIYALAYAVGSNIAFASGQFNPRSPAGQRLLAHELAHVVQQRNGAVDVQRSPDMRWVHDEKAARYRGRVMAARIRKHGKLSKEARAKIKSELQYFEGSARDAYLDEVRPALPSVVKFEAPVTPAPDEPPQPAPPSPPKESPKTCKRLPEVGPGKKCKFFVYDSTLSGALGIGWKRLAIADARVHSATYAIPSGENMEEMLYNVLSTYAEEGCDCTDEIQFWSHGSRGNGAWISDSHGGTSELETKHFEIPGVDQFGDNPKQPGYQEWSSKLSTYQRRLVVLRRTICDSDSTIYYRSCQAFQGEEGRKFARASSEFWRCNVAGHTKNVGLSQPGEHVLPVCQEPDWPESEGAEEEAKKNKPELREVKPK